MAGVPSMLVTALLLCSGTRAAKVRVDYSEDAVVEKTGAELHVRSIDLKNLNNVQYAGPFTIGEQTIPVIYDTGSFEVVTLTTECKGCPKALAKFNEDKDSDTFEKGKKKHIHKYVSGIIISQRGYDDLRFGRGTDNPYVAKGMTMWMVRKHSMIFWKTGRAIFSGVIGLSHLETLPAKIKKATGDDRSLLKQMKIAAFGMCLRRGDLGKGKLDYGFTAQQMKDKHPGAFTTVNVYGSHWGVRVTKIGINGHNTKGHCKPYCTALIDSGTSLIGIPMVLRPVFVKLMLRVHPLCMNLKELPDIELKIGGKRFTLPPKAWVYKGSTLLGIPFCKGAFTFVDKQKFGWAADVFILGMPFLRYHYTVFDRKHHKVHIANANENCEVAKGKGEDDEEELSLGLHADETKKSDVKRKHQLSAGRTAADYSQPTDVRNFDDVIYGSVFDARKIDTPWINSESTVETEQ
eukprot:TRINITY_DN1642_c0_g1_i1.p1 TRINITY_DN1642_c0_g1~~TRINITY_DN1642_c0_g1_i1.p1  ORF type:complete len:462 (-),score=77.12 TRINITY_DN1642_c0_g1_i1:112-1497(-)